jgi:hypothetical protein
MSDSAVVTITPPTIEGSIWPSRAYGDRATDPCYFEN